MNGDWDELDRFLSQIAASGTAEIHEDGQWLPDFHPLQFRIQQHGNEAFVHLWSAESNLTRRALRIRERSEHRIVLEVQRFGRVKPGRLEFLRTNAPRPAVRIAREQFRGRIQHILSDAFPDAVIESLTIAPDLKNSFSGLYVRGLMRHGSIAWALLAVPPGDEATSVEASLAFGILWLHWLRSRAARYSIAGLRIFVPENSSMHLRERILALSSLARTEIFEILSKEGIVRKLDPPDAGNVESRLVPRSDLDNILKAARDVASHCPPLAQKMSESHSPVAQCAFPVTSEALFSFRGLEFARWSVEGLTFGLGESSTPLTLAAQPVFERLLRQLEIHRNPLSAETGHPLYRKAPERWIETVIREDPTTLDAQLDARYLYSQVPAIAAGNRGILDLLGVTRRGQLVVIEIKASEDIQLSIQAVDYWLRVRRHQREGDFCRYGYFPGIELDAKPPLVWLVAPGLHFHSATEILLKYLSPEIRVTRIGLNENWRRGLKVIFRQ